MSLQTDKIFWNAVRNNPSLMQKVGDRVFNPADEDGGEFGENTDVPYLIITFDGLTNDVSTKDSYESGTDEVTISIEIAATCRAELADIAQTVRDTIKAYIESRTSADEDFDLVPYDYRFSAGPVIFDWMKPSVWQTLSYVCDTKA